jgi:hypothetical protein
LPIVTLVASNVVGVAPIIPWALTTLSTVTSVSAAVVPALEYVVVELTTIVLVTPLWSVMVIVSPLIAVTCPLTRAKAMLMLVAVVGFVDEASMPTRSPTTRSAALTVAEASVKAVVVVMTKVLDVPSRPVTVTDVGVTAVTTPPNITGRGALMFMLVAVVRAVEDT